MNNILNKRLSIVLGFVILFLSSCSGLGKPANKIEYYTLEYDFHRFEGYDPLSLAIKVERFSVAPLYNTNRIIYRDKSFKRKAYVYHMWQANPGDLVSYFLSRDMRKSGLFKAVLPGDSRLPSEYLLEGSVDEFFEWDEDEGWKAILTLTVTLMIENEPDVSKRILFQKTYGARESCQEKTPGALAEAMSKAMAKVTTQIIREIYPSLKIENSRRSEETPREKE
ncbi:ABC-type transport auxiliary lipoprotein family protein [Thermodesulfobacteriota bacterium]